MVAQGIVSGQHEIGVTKLIDIQCGTTKCHLIALLYDEIAQPTFVRINWFPECPRRQMDLDLLTPFIQQLRGRDYEDWSAVCATVLAKPMNERQHPGRSSRAPCHPLIINQAFR